MCFLCSGKSPLKKKRKEKERKKQRNAVAVRQGKSVVQKRLTEWFPAGELIVRGIIRVRPSVTYQPPFRPSFVP